MEFKLYAIPHLFFIIITSIPIALTIIFVYVLLKTQHSEEKLKKLVLYYSIFMSFSLLLLKVTKELTPNISYYYLSAKNKNVKIEVKITKQQYDELKNANQSEIEKFVTFTIKDNKK